MVSMPAPHRENCYRGYSPLPHTASCLEPEGVEDSVKVAHIEHPSRDRAGSFEGRPPMGVLVNEEGFPRGGVKRHQKSPCSNHYDPWNHRDRAQHLPAGQTLLPEEASRDDVEGAHAPRAVLPIDDGVATSDVEPAPIPGTGGDAPISQVWIGASPGDGRSPHR